MDEVTQGKVISSPVCVFTHPDTGTEVTLIGIIHIGHPHYYIRIQAILDDLAVRGATIHHESIGTPSPEELKALSRRWRRAVRRLSGSIAASREQPIAMGLAYQGDLMEPREAWENHDLKKIDVARIMGHRFVSLQYFFGKVMSYMLRNQTHEQFRASLLNQFPEKDDTPNLAKMPSALKKATERRDEVALDAVDNHAVQRPAAPLALVWGRGHVPFLSAGLVARGYVKTSEMWVPAIEERFLAIGSAERASAGAEAAAGTSEHL